MLKYCLYVIFKGKKPPEKKSLAQEKIATQISSRLRLRLKSRNLKLHGTRNVEIRSWQIYILNYYREVTLVDTNLSPSSFLIPNHSGTSRSGSI